MAIDFGFTDEFVNTQFAPLAALCAHYQGKKVFQPYGTVEMLGKIRDFVPTSKLIQILVSLLAGCDTLSEVNLKLKPEVGLAQACGWPRLRINPTCPACWIG